MTRRLHVRIGDEELAEFQRLARRRGITPTEWARQALRAACAAESRPGVGRKLAAVRRAAEHAYPTSDIDAMLAEIERGWDTAQTG